ncbi:MAG TPA: ribosome biogenesis GTPase YlqF [Candidatus Baltobacteraceae bacterium]
MNADLQRAVQWYPGHMVRAMRRIGEYLKMIDVVVEVVDARVPASGRNPLLDALIGSRKRLIVLDREDLADAATTKAWVERFASQSLPAIAVNGREQPSVRRAGQTIAKLASDVPGMSRAIVLGLPNSGKSSIINGLLRRAAARTEDRAGVTRQLQWFRMAGNVELMDTPGILVPKIATPEAQWKLAMVGAVPRDRYDPQEIVGHFHRWLIEHRAGRTRVPDLETFARERGFSRKGGEFDLHNAAQSYVSAFNDGVFGRISLEEPT